jgi:uncharacterized OB-fold protein
MSAQNFTSAGYFQTIHDQKIVGSKCKECGTVHLPPREICTACLSNNMEEVHFSGKGKLAAFSVIYVPPTAMIEAGFGRDNPNVAGIVELVEGPMISAQILGLDVTKPAEIKIGTPLTATFIERGEKTFLAFEV